MLSKNLNKCILLIIMCFFAFLYVGIVFDEACMVHLYNVTKMHTLSKLHVYIVGCGYILSNLHIVSSKKLVFNHKRGHI